jgi:RND family efflux transporter MFP subunit
VWWLVGLLALAGVGSWYVWLRGEPARAQTDRRVVIASRGNLTASISPTGEVEAVRRLDLGFAADGVELVEPYVSAGQEVKQGDPLARVDEEPLRRAVDQAEAQALAQAELAARQAAAALREAQERLQALSTDDVSAARDAVAAAARRLEAARASLAALEAGTAAQEQIDLLQWRYNEAEAFRGGLLEQTHVTEEGLDRQHAAYNAMMDARDALETARARAELDLLTARHNVARAERSLAEAQAMLRRLEAGEGALARAQAENRVAQAELDLARAQEHLATVLADPQEQDILLAQARYDAALATRAQARAALEGASLVTPADGTVLSVSAEVGDLVASSTPVLTLADLTNLRVVAIVDETDIGQVAAGQSASITFDALPGQRFGGRVLEVLLEGTLSSSVVTYQVPVSLEGAEDAALLPGMTANVTIVTGQRENALLLPILALEQDDQGYYVLVDDGAGGSTAARVQIGLDNGQYVEVTRGLLEGDRVLVRLLQGDTGGPFPFVVGPGGATSGIAVPLGGMGR